MGSIPGELLGRFRDVQAAAKAYNSFSGISDKMSGSVRFIYLTDGIG